MRHSPTIGPSKIIFVYSINIYDLLLIYKHVHVHVSKTIGTIIKACQIVYKILGS